MKFSQQSLIHNQSPEYRHALQELIKFELQALVERLSATGEEALVLTASCQDGSTMQFGSQKAEGFLRKRTSLGQDFLSHCHEETVASSGDELCHSADDLDEAEAKDSTLNSQVSTKAIQYSPIRPRERTNSKRSSFTEKEPTERIYEVSQNSDLSASERNDSVASFAEAEARENIDKTGGKKTVQCKICSRPFRSYKALGQHLRLHMSQSYKCSVCSRVFTLKKSYLRHIKSHKPQKAGKVFECGWCNKSFANLNSWKRHRLCHVDVRKYSCNLCGKAFYEKYSLRVHQTSHFYLDKSLDVSSGYSCHICGKVSKTKTVMKNHLLTHSAKKFTCEFCNKRFSLKYSYVRHRRIHTGEKPYKCGACDRSFSDGSAWAKHIKTHTGIKPYSCDLCPKSFFDKTLCKTHMNTHKGRKPYKQADEENKRNFKIVTDNLPSAIPDKNYEGDEEPAADDNLSDDDDDLNLRLVTMEKESEDSQLLNTGYGKTLLSTDEGKTYTAANKTPEKKKKVSSMMDSFVLDEKFQSDFVERNMPLKPIESDNELISTAFPEDSDILVEDTESEMPHSVDSEALYTTTEQVQHITDVDKQSAGWHKKPAAHRRSTRGKVFAESPAKCKICHKKFKQESLLKQHLQFHCMSKLYKCRYCGKQLSTKHSLIRHERIHVGERPYQCYICQKTFADNYGCIRHVNTHFHKEVKGSVPSSGRGYRIKVHEEAEFAFDKKADRQSEYIKPETELLLSGESETFSQAKIPTTVKKDKNKYNESIADITSYPDTAVTDGNSKNLLQLTSRGIEQKVKLSSDCTKETPQSLSSESSMQEINKHLYKCFKCGQLFTSEKLCIDHIQETCSRLALPASDRPSASTSSPSLPLPTMPVAADLHTETPQQSAPNLYQCSLCCLMFEDKGLCESHIANQCQKPREQVKGDCVVSSILNESFLDAGLSESSYEPLPQLPFPDVSTDTNYLNISDDHVLLISKNAGVSSTTPGQPGAQSPIANEAPSSNTMSRDSNSTSLSFIPFTQIASQASPSVQVATAVQSTVKLATDSQFTGLLQKPIVNVGSSNFIISNQGLNFVGQKTVTAVGQHTATAGVKVSSKPEKKKDDIEERTCDICHKVFTTKHILKQHVLIHMERKFGCKFCMKKFHHKYGRDRHERIHTGEKPFTCPVCKTAFGDNSTYRKHTRVCCSNK